MTLPTVGAGPSAAAEAAFVGALDGLSNLEHVYWPPAVLLSAHDGSSTATLRRDSDDDETTTSRGDADGTIDTATLTTWASGADIFVVTAVDQVGSDNITQATTTNQPELILSDASFDSKPSMTFSNDYLQGAFTNGGTITQPITIYVLGKADVADPDASAHLINGENNSNNCIIYRRATNDPDAWAIFAGAELVGGDSDANANLFTALFNGASSQMWINGVSEVSGNAGARDLDGLTIGAKSDGTIVWEGEILGAIIVDGNSSDADKNQVGNDVANAIYGLSYTDIT